MFVQLWISNAGWLGARQVRLPQTKQSGAEPPPNVVKAKERNITLYLTVARMAASGQKTDGLCRSPEEDTE
jgi:hypothetical protein